MTPKITAGNGKANREPGLSDSKSSTVSQGTMQSCSSICHGPKKILLQKRYLSQDASPKSSLLWLLSTILNPRPNKQINTRRTLVGKGADLQEGSLCGETVVHASETGCISQSSWHIPGSEAAHAAGPLCFLGCVFLWSPWLVRSPSLGRALRPYPSHLIRKVESGLRQQTRSQLSQRLLGHLPAD